MASFLNRKLALNEKESRQATFTDSAGIAAYRDSGDLPEILVGFW